MNNVDYYKNKDIQERILDFFSGWHNGKKVKGSKYWVGYGESELWKGNSKAYWSATKFDDVFYMLDQGLDIFASMWRRDGTFLALDIEYYNHDYPGEPYAKPEKTFRKIEPVYEIIKKVFNEYNIDPLITMTGQGYHFTSLWPFEEDHDLLEHTGSLEFTLREAYKNRLRRRGGKIPSNAAYGYSGAFRLLQFLTLKIIKTANEKISANEKIVPVVYSDISTGKIGCGLYGDGREGISLDLTLYSDPIHMRDIRVPFSTHQKHKTQKWKVGEWLADTTPICTCIPRSIPGKGEPYSLKNLLKLRRQDDNSHFKETTKYAKMKGISTKLPHSADGWKNVYEDYTYNAELKLREFHRIFDEKIYAPGHYPEINIDKLFSILPNCITHSLREPNDNLLKPTNVQALVRVLTKKNWHPKDIANLIYFRYKDMKDWGNYNASSLAYFWAQLYGGALHTGVDKKLDLNCVSHKERGFCWDNGNGCSYNLMDFK